MKGKQVLHKITKMSMEFKQVLIMYQNSPGTKYCFQNVYGSPQAEIFLMTYRLKTKLNLHNRFKSLNFLIFCVKSCPKGKNNHEASLRSRDCKFWMGPEDPFRTCQPCLRSPWPYFKKRIAWINAIKYGVPIIISAAGGSPCDISQGLPRALTKSNKPPIS